MSKLILCFLPALIFSTAAWSQYWQQKVNYTIEVSLNDKEHTLDAFEKLEYFNNSPDTLRFIWFHIWLNAYKNDKTAFSEQLLINDRTDFYFSKKEQRGYINRLDFKIDGITAQVADHPQYIDIIKIFLPKPLLPGSSIIIETPFHVQLPQNFSRGGHTGQSYQVTQWFPKPAVYDCTGWHPIPYLNQGEFYSEFGNYDVRITVPENYVVAATGTLQNIAEKEWLKKRALFTWKPEITRTFVKKGSYKHLKKTIQLYPLSAGTTKTLQFVQDSVHDFAWFADKRFIVQEDTLQLASGRIIHASSFYLPGQNTAWKQAVEFIKRAIQFRSAVIGEYPFNTVSAVETKMGVNGGMEYPTITSISPGNSSAALEEIIEHEIGHNWLQGILATNERAFPWMDEGINTYYDNRYKIKNDVTKENKKFLTQRIPDDAISLLFQSQVAVKKDQPINTTSENFTELNYGLVAYYKTGQWLSLLENYLGTSMFDSCMHVYYNRWKFKHPYPEDFKSVCEEISRKNIQEVYQLADTTGNLARSKKIIKTVAFFNFTNTGKYNYIDILPAVGYNQYDGFMPGLLVHNYNLPPDKFKFLIAPLYATAGKKINYVARASYTWFPAGNLYSAETGISTAAFSTDQYQATDGEKLITGFRKIVPFLKLTLKEKDPLSKKKRYVLFKPFFITETALNFKTVIGGQDTMNVIEKNSAGRYLNQLTFVVENNRRLYPYQASFQLEQANGFIRAAFTGNYYFNYNDKAGLGIRLFAGKFFYTTGKTFTKQFETDRYHLNMTGANGYEDYTYSNYFTGRNAFEGTSSRQIMMRDGAFKVRTDLLSSKIGKTDNWLGAINCTSDIADKKFPVKLFADIGTYGDAWQNNAATARFLFDAGLQLSLLHQTVNIYLPLLYSSVYRDYYKSTLGKGYVFKSISFSIDIQHFNLRKINNNLDY